jgi:hypothetical protein
LESETVSRANLLDSIAAVSAKFTFNNSAAIALVVSVFNAVFSEVESDLILLVSAVESDVDLLNDRAISNDKLVVNTFSAAVALATSAAKSALELALNELILLDNETVSRANLLDSIAEVSAYFTPVID